MDGAIEVDCRSSRVCIEPRMNNEMSRIIGTSFALTAFTVAVLAGLASENDAAQILLRAVAAMIVCYPVGFIAGAICDQVVHNHSALKKIDVVNEDWVDEVDQVGATGAMVFSAENKSASRESTTRITRAAA